MKKIRNNFSQIVIFVNFVFSLRTNFYDTDGGKIHAALVTRVSFLTFCIILDYPSLMVRSNGKQKGKMMSHLSVVSHLSIVSHFQMRRIWLEWNSDFFENESPENNSRRFKKICYSQSDTVWYFWWTWSFENWEKGTHRTETKWSQNKNRIFSIEQEDFQNEIGLMFHSLYWLKIW